VLKTRRPCLRGLSGGAARIYHLELVWLAMCYSRPLNVTKDSGHTVAHQKITNHY
jgi:hypothetical protein